MMPPSNPLPTDNGRIARKRKAPLNDNGDPVISNPPKRKKTELKSKPAPPKKKSVPEKVAPAKRRPAVKIEEVPDEGDNSYEKPRNSRNILEAADGSDDEFGAPLSEVISFDTDTDEEVSPKIVEDDEEDDEAELSMYLYSVRSLVDFKFFSARMSKKWTSPVYVFFENTPDIQYKEGRRCHVFKCAATQCKGRNTRHVYRFLDKGDANSTSNLLRHAKNAGVRKR